MYDDTALVRMVIEDLSKARNWTYEETIDAFYTSGTCRALSDRRTGVFTYPPLLIIELFENNFEF